MSDIYHENYRVEQKNLSKGSRNWYGFYPSTGKWKTLKTSKKREAELWRDRMNANRFMPEPPKEETPISIAQAADMFMSVIERERRRETGTAKAYNQILRGMREFFNDKGVERLCDATPQLAAEFIQALHNNSPKTIANKVVVMRSFFNWAIDHYSQSSKNPFAKIKAPKGKPSVREFWTVEECERIISCADDRETAAFFALQAFAGLRVSEARKLKTTAINGKELTLIGKGSKLAKLPISTRLAGHINAWLIERANESGDLFPSFAKFQKMSANVLEKSCAKAGIVDSHIHYHRFRHSFASNLIRLGRSIKAVQMLMRHENVSLTLNIYGHLLPSDLTEAVEI